jgi:glycosyltransferase involved in cell wall biosynthesis
VGLPIDWTEGRLPSHPVLDPPLRILYIGGARKEKGFALLPDAITALAQIGTARFIISIRREDRREDSLGSTVERLRDLSPSVAIIEGYIPRSAYLQLIEEASCVVLAYDPDRYRLRSSSILIEALGRGRPVITTAGTWMAGIVEEYALPPLFMKSFDAASLTETLCRFMKAPEPYLRAYASIASKVRRDHNPARFFDEIHPSIES